MTDDIVTRLRAVLHNDRSVELMNREAADEIEVLRSIVTACHIEIARLTAERDEAYTDLEHWDHGGALGQFKEYG